MKIVVLDGYTLFPGDLDMQPLLALGDVVFYDRTPPQEVAARIGDAPIVLTNKARITREIMQACPELRYIGVLATGYNVVDIEAASERGIVVTNVPAYSTQAVAQHTMALLLASMSRVHIYDAKVKAGEWNQSPDFCFYAAPAVELCGKTLGVIGFGSIGRTVARAAQALGMTRWQTIISVIVPQAVRRALPGCGNEIIYLVKYSSLAYLVTCIELTGEAKVLVSRTFRPTEVYLVAACYYLAMVTAATWLLAKLEKKLAIPGFGTQK